MSLQRIPINNFRGGLNTRDGPFDLQPNESPDLQNVTITALVGQLQVRLGKTRFDTNSPAATIDHARQTILTNSGTSYHWLMCSINGSVYSCDTAGNFTLRFTGTVATIWDFAQMPDASGVDHVWMMNGVDAPQKWDGVAGTTSAWTNPGANYGRLQVWRNLMVLCPGGVATSTQQRLFFSYAGDPEATVQAYTPLDIRGDDDELDSLNEINVLADRLYAFKNRSVWIVTDPGTLANRRVDEPGCTGRFQSDVSEDKLYFFNEQGLWSTAGVQVALESGSITNYFPQHLNLAAISKVRVMGTRDSYPRILVTLPIDGSSVNNVMIEVVPHINFRRIGGRRYLLLPAFMLHSFDASCLINFKGADGEWGVYGGSASAHKLYRYFNGTTDDGATITAYWTSAWMAIQGEEPFERIRRLNVELSGDVIVDVLKDFNVSPDFSATMTNPSTGGDEIWDNDPHTWDELGQWDASATYRFARLRPESRGRFHAIRFRTLPGGDPFFINVAELVIRGGKEH